MGSIGKSSEQMRLKHKHERIEYEDDDFNDGKDPVSDEGRASKRRQLTDDSASTSSWKEWNPEDENSRSQTEDNERHQHGGDPDSDKGRTPKGRQKTDDSASTTPWKEWNPKDEYSRSQTEENERHHHGGGLQ
jgi:hypothetical protein